MKICAQLSPRARRSTIDPTGRPVDYSDDRLFSDPDPVPAVRELRERGVLDHTVTTHLVDEVRPEDTEVSQDLPGDK